jgi:hypothetical protein
MAHQLISTTTAEEIVMARTVKERVVACGVFLLRDGEGDDVVIGTAGDLAEIAESDPQLLGRSRVVAIPCRDDRPIVDGIVAKRNLTADAAAGRPFIIDKLRSCGSRQGTMQMPTRSKVRTFDPY